MLAKEKVFNILLKLKKFFPSIYLILKNINYKDEFIILFLKEDKFYLSSFYLEEYNNRFYPKFKTIDYEPSYDLLKIRKYLKNNFDLKTYEILFDKIFFTEIN